MSRDSRRMSRSNVSDRFETDKRLQIASQEGDVNDSKDHMLHQQTMGNEYNPLAFPPDISKARKHGIARRVARIEMANAKEAEMCEDCGLPTKNELLPICGSRIDLADLGPGFPLYYEYVLFCGILLILLFCIVGIYNIIVNIKGTQCEFFSNHTDYPCNGGFIMNLSLGNRLITDDFTVSNILNLVFVVVGMLVSFYYRRVQSMTAEEVNRGAITSADYAVIVKGIPETETPEKIKKFFEDHGRPFGKTCVKKVVCAYEIGTYVDMARKKAKLISKKGKSDEPANLDEDLRLLEEKMQAFESEIANNSSQKFTGIAFISFNTEKEAKGVIEKFKMTGFERTMYSFFSSLLSWLGVKFEKTYNGKLIDLDRAPEPFDVFWENLGHDKWDVIKKRTLTLLSSFILIAISFGMILGVSFLQEEIKKKTKSNFAVITLLSLLSSYLITFINSLIGFFMRKLAGYEKHTTYTYYFISIATKLSYAQFFNTALITFIVQIIRGQDDIRLWTSDSIVSKAFFLFVLNAIVPSLSYIFNPLYLWKLYKRSSVISEGSESKLTQQEANKLFEGPAFDIAQRYANVQKTMLFTGFYANLLPIGIPISIAALFLTYWTDKYMLLRRHCKPNSLGKELSEQMADFLELFLVAFMCGNLAFEKITRQEISLLTIIALAIAVAAYILPQKFLSKCIRADDDGVFNSKQYDDVKFYFMTEYDRSNPITQEDAMREWFMELAKLEETPAENSDSNNVTQADEKPNMINFFQNLPKEGTLNTLLNYAQVNPSFHQVQSNSNNFNRHLPAHAAPQQVHQRSPASSMQFMQRPQFNGFPGMQPGFNSFMNNMQQVMGNRLMGMGQQPMFMPQRPQAVVHQGPKPVVASHIPQAKPQVAGHFSQQQPQQARQIPTTQHQQQAHIVQINPAMQQRSMQQSYGNPIMMHSNVRQAVPMQQMQMSGFQQQQPQRVANNSSFMQASMANNSQHYILNQRTGQAMAHNFGGSMANQFESGLKNVGNKFNGFGF